MAVTTTRNFNLNSDQKVSSADAAKASSLGDTSGASKMGENTANTTAAPAKAPAKADTTTKTAADRKTDSSADSQANAKQKAKDAVDAIKTERDTTSLAMEPHDEPGPFVEESQKRMVPPEIVQGISTPSAIESANKSDVSDSDLQEAVNDWANENFKNVEEVRAIREPDILRVEMRTIHGTSKDAVEGVAWSKAGVKKALAELQKKMKG